MWIVAVNVIFYLAVNFLELRISGIPLMVWLSLIPGIAKYGYVWQFVTYMFVHSGPMHLIFNMYALLIFGVNCERCIGSREFILFYMLSGILGGVIGYIVYTLTGTNAMIMGASGAVYALLFLTSVLFPYNRILLYFFIPLKMPVAVLVFIGTELLSQVVGRADGISHLIHLSSILIAWIYCVARFRISPVKVWKEAL